MKSTFQERTLSLTDELGLDLLANKFGQLLGFFCVVYFVLEMSLKNLLHELCGDRRLESRMNRGMSKRFLCYCQLFPGDLTVVLFL